jgi:pimeloyl-ACP methyl ester carboxylesterase
MSYQFAEINGVRMHFDVQGDAEQALVLIHAGVANLNIWDEQISAFSPHFKTLRYDVRGWGETPDPAGKYTEYDDLSSLLDHLEIKSCAVLGNSNGGRIAIDFAIAFPHRVSKLIVVAPGLGGFDYPNDSFDEEQSKKQAEALKAGDIELAAEIEAQMWFDGPNRRADQVDPKLRAKALEMMLHTLKLPEGIGEGSILQPPAAGRLSEIEASTLVIMGDQDMESLYPVADALEHEIANAKRVTMPGLAHLPSLENPELFNQIVLDFLSE